VSLALESWSEAGVIEQEQGLKVRLKYLIYLQSYEHVHFLGFQLFPPMKRAFSQHVLDDAPPANVLQFRLLDSYFRPGRPRLLGLDLTPTMPGYQFAVYERISEERTAE
jgi:hypothetical protein